ncbi:MAG TPA: CheR family methyltransferase [Solirubrobacteraceae bacterium]
MSGISTPRPDRARIAPALLATNEWIWKRLPTGARDLRPIRAYGSRLHSVVARQADREMYLGTLFLRNRPALELMRRLVQKAEPGATVKITVLGCSIGVEVYSILWTLRRTRPDVEFIVNAVDISPDAVRIGAEGVYGTEALQLVDWPIFEGLTDDERQGMFDWEGDVARVKPWLRRDTTWQVGDASDPDLIAKLAPQDLVVASNFLCHMPAPSARSCLSTLAELVGPGGHLFVTGVDLDVRTEVARDLRWEPVSELRAEIHDGDKLVRNDWPWRWWGLEPLDTGRPDWELRYSAVFKRPGAVAQASSV